MTTRWRNSAATRVAMLMSFLLAFLSLTPFAAGGKIYAEPGPYTPLPGVTPAYTGALTWKHYTAPVATPGVPVPSGYNSPYFIVFDDEDNAYVTKLYPTSNTSNPVGKVEKISNDGESVTNLTFDAAFKYPIGIAVDHDGNVYVSDNSKAQNSSISGNVARILMLPHGEESWVDLTHNSAMYFAAGVAVDRQGNVYAVDSSNGSSTVKSRILKLPKGGTSWSNITGTPSPFGTIVDIAVDGGGNVFVSDLLSNIAQGGRIFKLPAGGTAWTNITPTVTAGGIPFIAQGIGIDKSDTVYGLNLYGGNIMKLGYNGGSNDWTNMEVVSNLPLSVYNLDVAVDSSGYLYSTNIGYGNVQRLMASILYNGNANTGGTVPEDTAGYKPNTEATVKGDTGNLVKSESLFAGWNTKADGTGTSYAAGAKINMTQSVMLYAVWSPVASYTVTYQAAAGGSVSGSGSETVTGGRSPASVPNVTPDPGYTFRGWSSDGGTTLLTGDQLASAVITGNITYTAYFQAPVTLTSLTLDSAAYSLAIGGTHQTAVTAVYSDQSTNALSSGVTYSSSNTAVATVDNTGLVTAVAAGQAEITATYEGEQAKAVVTVNDQVPSVTLTGLTLDSAAYSLAIGGTHQTAVTAVYSDQSTNMLSSGVTYSSSDTAVATVDNTGLVTAVAAGQAEITAEYEGEEAKAAVTVTDPVPHVTLTSLTLDSAAYSLAIGGTHQTAVTAVYSDESTNALSSGVTYSSSNTAVATVDNTGLVTAVAAGQAEITATYEGEQAKAAVTVTDPVPTVTLTGLTLNSAAYSLALGGTHQTTVTAVYSDESTSALSSGVSYSSSDTAVATVSSTGLVTAVAAGQAEITAEYEGEQVKATVTVTSPPPPPPVPGPETKPDPGVEVIVDGVKQEQLATAREDTVGGQVVTTVVLDSLKVIDKLRQDSNKLISIPLSGDRKVVNGELNGALVKAMESNDAQIQIVTDKATYTLPASQINIDSISAQVGTGVKLEEITVRIQISETSDGTTAQVQAAAQRNQLETVGHPVDFEITASYGSQSIQANQFNSYVGRMIALPEGIDPNKITTGVVLTADGELFHVPTSVVQRDGKLYALINSLTNSTYSVVYNPLEMNDVKDHWAKAVVNDMSSRMIMPGVTATEFDPDASITRAEFTAIVTRGLGIQNAPYAGGFTDVATGSRYAGAVQAAVNYKLIGGYENGTFRPDQTITRQEATAVLARATGIAKLKSELSEDEVNRLLSAFTDGSEAAGWARSNVAAAISLKIMNGRGGRLDLDAELTRAETAALVRRFLQAAKLINS